MRSHDKKSPRVTVVACGVFKPALKVLESRLRVPRLKLKFLPSSLHLQPAKLQEEFISALNEAESKRGDVVCLYGDCFAGIKDCCIERRACKVPGTHCYEMLLGTERFRKLIDEHAGTYFLEGDLIRDFEKCCAIPLELHDEVIRKMLFKHYKRLVYVRQPVDGDLVARAERLARFLELTLQVEDADYSHLERELCKIVKPK